MPQPHPLDAMLQLQPQPDGSFVAHTHAGYANMVGPYGGATAALCCCTAWVLQHPGLPGPAAVADRELCRPGARRCHAPGAPRRAHQPFHPALKVEPAPNQYHHRADKITTTATVVTAVRRATFSADAVAAPTANVAAADCPSVDGKARHDLAAAPARLAEAISGNLPSV